jgi:uncharacterized protein (DUF1778 family)
MRREKQLLVRVTTEELAVLEAAAALVKSNATAFAREAILREVESLARDDLVQRQMALHVEQEARREGSVLPIKRSRFPRGT